MKRLCILVGVAFVAAPAHSETITCSRSFQGYETCQGPGGYRSTEWECGGARFGSDNAGARWMSIDRQGREITIERRDQ
jgi:hypothetical protein